MTRLVEPAIVTLDIGGALAVLPRWRPQLAPHYFMF